MSLMALGFIVLHFSQGSASSFSLSLVEGRSRTSGYSDGPVARQRSGGQQAKSASLDWKDCLRQTAEWYSSGEATRVADNVLLYQRDNGGWPKNINMAAVLTPSETEALIRQKTLSDTTIDNGATFSQISFLARVFTATRQERLRAAALRGLDFLLKAQYENGGWPQFFPDHVGYRAHITFNDGAMAGVLNLLLDVARKQPDYAFVDEARRAAADVAVRRGVECILKSQILVAGKRTAWCAQHDERTLEPASARTYENVSLSGHESVGIVKFLMRLEKPNAEIVQAIKSAIAWFKEARLSGIRLVQQPDPSTPKGFDRVIVKDAAAGPLWARFYEIGTNRPIFSGRDGIIKSSLAEIEYERRVGYDWYTTAPAALLENEYARWRDKQKKR